MGGKGSSSVKPERNEPTKAVPAQDPMGADHQVFFSVIFFHPTTFHA
jgi:hypothetical protein